MDNKPCECGTGFIHDRSECKAACRCLNCEVTMFFNQTKVNSFGEVVCPYCNEIKLFIWNNEAEANEMYPEGCRCENNGDYCLYCEAILAEPETESEEEWEMDFDENPDPLIGGIDFN